MNDERKELRDYFKNLRDKYIYYIGVLSITMIGCILNFEFVIEKMKLLKFIPIALLMTLLFYGIKFFHNKLSLIYKEHVFNDIKNGENEITGINPKQIEIGLNSMIMRMINDNKKSNFFFKLQFYPFLFGCISFI